MLALQNMRGKPQSATIVTSVKYLLIFILVQELRYVAGFIPSNIKIIKDGYTFNASVYFPSVSIVN